jgi:hypothetical protein
VQDAGDETYAALPCTQLTVKQPFLSFLLKDKPFFPLFELYPGDLTPGTDGKTGVFLPERSFVPEKKKYCNQIQ